jgi:antitoxin (DNA-binding transcriptional repressor) of toxin-antitoxin stability system
MKEINIREARQALSRLERLLEEEEELTITRRGEAIARVSRIGRKRRIPSHKGLRNALPRLRKKSETMIREDRDAK